MTVFSRRKSCAIAPKGRSSLQVSYPDGHIQQGPKNAPRPSPEKSPVCAQKRAELIAASRSQMYIVGRSATTPESRYGASMRTLGILWILYGLERFVVALAMFLCIPTLTVMWGALLTRVPNPFTLMDLFHFFLIFAIILSVVAGIISILAGLALTSGGASARKLGMLAAFLALLSGPLGIALGAYTLVVLVPAKVRNA